VENEVDDWLQAESEVTQQKMKTVSAWNLVLEEQERPRLIESRGASFQENTGK